MEPALLARMLQVSGVEAAPGALLQARACSALAGTFLRVLRAAPAHSPARHALLARLRSACAPHSPHHLHHLLLLRLVLQRLARAPQHPPALLASFLSDLTLDLNVNPDEVTLARALLNVHPEHPYLENLTRKYLMCSGDVIVQNFLINVWSKDIFACKDLNDRLALKAVPEIEKILLDTITDIIESKDEYISERTPSPIENLINRSSRSPNCFQICCKILNYLFIASSFNLKLQNYIELFVKKVRLATQENEFTSLYDDELQSAVMMLNCDMAINDCECDILVDDTLEMLTTLKNKSEEHFIMLMSHYSIWFDHIQNKEVSIQN